MGRDIIRTGIIKEPLSEKEMKRYNETVPYLPPQLAKFGSAGYCLPSQLDADYIRNDFKIYPDDIWIVTPPKCGTTWMQEIVWLLHTDVDLSKSNYNQFYRVPFLEVELILPSFLHVHPQPDFKNLEKNEDNLLKFMTHSFQYVETMQRPRIIKTHLPLELLPRDILDTCKVIYLARNPKDVCVSWWHHCQLHGFNKDFDQMAQLYKDGLQAWTPIVPHLLNAWQSKGHPNFFFTTYESMKRDLHQNVRQVATFIGKTGITEEQVEALVDAVDIEKFRHNKFVNKSQELPPRNGHGFIRKGKIGDWKNHFSPEMSAEWDLWLENQLKGTGLESLLL